MKTKLLAGIALSALASAVAMTGNAFAADLGGNGGGSVKDGGYMAPMPELVRGAAGPCYFRADVGYSWARDPEVRWPVNSDLIQGFYEGNDTNNKFHETDRDSKFVTDDVSNTTRENGAFGEFGMGCGFGGSRGIRAEMMFGVRGNRKVDGEPGAYTLEYDVIDDPNTAVVPIPVHPFYPVGNGEEIDDPLHTSIRSYTYMFNFYKDLGKFGNITPYVGAGAGVAYHMVDETYFTGNPFLTNKIEGNNDISFAWSLMAGVGYQVSDRAILDFGYRYMDMGSAESGRVDSAGFVNPRVEFDDLTAHEIKVGLRYHFGDDCCAAQSYAPMK